MKDMSWLSGVLIVWFLTTVPVGAGEVVLSVEAAHESTSGVEFSVETFQSYRDLIGE